MKAKSISFQAPCERTALALAPLPNKITQYILETASEEEPYSFIVFLRTVSQSFRLICDRSYILSAGRFCFLSSQKEILEKPIVRRLVSNFIYKFSKNEQEVFLGSLAFSYFVSFVRKFVEKNPQNKNEDFFINIKISKKEDINICMQQIEDIEKHELPIKLWRVNVLSLVLSKEILELIIKMVKKYGFILPCLGLGALTNSIDLQLASMVCLSVEVIPELSILTILDDTLKILKIGTINGTLDLSEAKVLEQLYIENIGPSGTVIISGDSLKKVTCKKIKGIIDASNATFIEEMVLSEVTRSTILLGGIIKMVNFNYWLLDATVDASKAKNIGVMLFSDILINSEIKTGKIIGTLNFTEGVEEGILDLSQTEYIGRKNLGEIGTKSKVINPKNL